MLDNICLILQKKKYNKRKKKWLLSSLNKEIFYKIDEGDSDDEIEEAVMVGFERR